MSKPKPSKSHSDDASGSSRQLFRSKWLNRAMRDAREIRRLRRVEAEISDSLLDQIHSQLTTPDRQQALFALLGSGFVLKNFPYHKVDEGFLDRQSAEKKAALLAEAKAFIDAAVMNALEDYRLSVGIDEKLLKDVREIFFSDLHDQITKNLVRSGKMKIRKTRKGRTKTTELEDTHEDRATFVFGALYELFETGNGVEEMALHELANKVLILPRHVRQRIYERMYFVSGAEEQRASIDRFEERVRMSLEDHRVRSLSDWDGKRHVDSSVIVAYERSEGLKTEVQATFSRAGVDDALILISKIIALCSLTSRPKSPTSIFWLVKAINYFIEDPEAAGGARSRSPSPSNPDKALRMATQFDILAHRCLFSNELVFSIGQDVYDDLEQFETELLIQLHHDLRVGLGGSVDPTLFSTDIVAEESTTRSALWEHFLTEEVVAPADLVHFSDLRLFFRKWLSEAFVGTLSPNGASLVWDYLLLQNFSPMAARTGCLAVFHLLVPVLRGANTYRKIQRVLMEGPRALHISSIPGAPNIPQVLIVPPSAGTERQAMTKRMETITMDYIKVSSKGH